MSDPLSVAASIGGLVSVALKVGTTLGPYVAALRDTPKIAIQVHSETQAATIILSALQKLTQDLNSVARQRAALIQVDQVIAVLTDGVLLFSELEACVGDLPPADSSITRLGLRSRLGWARKETDLAALLNRLQGFKVTISTILDILQTDSSLHAEQSQQRLAADVGLLLEHNKDLARRLMNLEDVFDAQSVITKSRRESLASTADTASLVTVNPRRPPSRDGAVLSPVDSMFDSRSTAVGTPESLISPQAAGGTVSAANMSTFEDDLELSRVYRKAANQRNTMDFSFRSSVARSHAWSIFSGLSLGEISVLSVIALPVYADDIVNSHHYRFGETIGPRAAKKRSDFPSGSVIADRLRHSLWREGLAMELHLSQLAHFKELFEAAKEHSSHPLLVIQRVFAEGYPFHLLIDLLNNTGSRSSHFVLTRGVAHQLIREAIDLLSETLDVGTDKLFTVGDVTGETYRFLKVLPVLKRLVVHLIKAGKINPRDVDVELNDTIHLDNYSPTGIQEFIAGEISFVDELSLFRVAWDNPTGFHSFSTNGSFITFREILRLQVNFLLEIEYNLFRPFKEQLWALHLQQWYYSVAHYCSPANSAREELLLVVVGIPLRVRYTWGGAARCARFFESFVQRPKKYDLFMSRMESVLGDLESFAYPTNRVTDEDGFLVKVVQLGPDSVLKTKTMVLY